MPSTSPPLLSGCCSSEADVLGEASSRLAHFRYVRCCSCEAVSKETFWLAFGPRGPKGWTQALARLLAELDAEARAASYS